MIERPDAHSYARVERERRFLLERLPSAGNPDDYRRPEDLFIKGSHLRLRVFRRPSGEWMARCEVTDDARYAAITLARS